MFYAHIAEAAGMTSYQEAYIRGFDLYHLHPEGYPAITPGQGTVYGYTLSFAHRERALTDLDELEELHLEPPTYRREAVLAHPLEEQVWVYIYNGALSAREGATLIPSGDWQPHKIV